MLGYVSFNLRIKQMKTMKSITALMLALVAISGCSKKDKAINSTGQASESKKEQTIFNNEQVGAIEKIVHTYLINNPTVVAESIVNLQRQAAENQHSITVELLNKNKDELQLVKGIPVIGAADADVTFVVFGDYADNSSKDFFTVLKSTCAQDKKVRVVYRLLSDTSAISQKLARIAMAAYELGVFEAVHEKLISVSTNATEGDLITLAAAASGIDRGKIEAVLDSASVKEMLLRNRALAEKLGITQAPGFVVGEILLKQAITAEQMKMLLENLRAQKK
jgi:protein-disulfide isomerase